MRTVRVLTIISLLIALSVAGVLPSQATKVQGAEPVKIDFNDLTEQQFVGTHYTGLTFSPEWRAADHTTGGYNTAGYPPHSWPVQIWTGTYGHPEPWSNTGRIDFASPVSQFGGWFCADYGTVYLEAYDAGGTLVASNSLGPNYGSSSYLSVSDSQGRIKYVIIHDTSNYWSVDDLEYTPAAGIRIVSPNAGDTFWIEAEPEPTMPRIVARAELVGIAPTPPLTITEFVWNAKITYMQHGRSDSQMLGPKSMLGETYTTWVPNYKNLILGGEMEIEVYVDIGGKRYQDKISVHIRGKNPSKETVKDTLGQLILQVICYKEAYPKWQQFDDSGLPVFGPPSGFGVMQLDPPSYSVQIWSWLRNVQEGKSRWREKIAMSRAYVKQVKKANADQKVTNLSPQQDERQAAYLYRGGCWVGGQFQYYYIWSRASQQWELNPNAEPTSVLYADDAMSIKEAVSSGSPPSGW